MTRRCSQSSKLLENSRNVIAREPLASVAISKCLIIGRRDRFASLAMTAKKAFHNPLIIPAWRRWKEADS